MSFEKIPDEMIKKGVKVFVETPDDVPLGDSSKPKLGDVDFSGVEAKILTSMLKDKKSEFSKLLTGSFDAWSKKEKYLLDKEKLREEKIKEDYYKRAYGGDPYSSSKDSDLEYLLSTYPHTSLTSEGLFIIEKPNSKYLLYDYKYRCPLGVFSTIKDLLDKYKFITDLPKKINSYLNMVTHEKLHTVWYQDYLHDVLSNNQCMIRGTFVKINILGIFYVFDSELSLLIYDTFGVPEKFVVC